MSRRAGRWGVFRHYWDFSYWGVAVWVRHGGIGMTLGPWHCHWFRRDPF